VWSVGEDVKISECTEYNSVLTKPDQTAQVIQKRSIQKYTNGKGKGKGKL